MVKVQGSGLNFRFGLLGLADVINCSHGVVLFLLTGVDFLLAAVCVSSTRSVSRGHALLTCRTARSLSLVGAHGSTGVVQSLPLSLERASRRRKVFSLCCQSLTPCQAPLSIVQQQQQ